VKNCAGLTHLVSVEAAAGATAAQMLDRVCKPTMRSGSVMK